MSTCTVELVSRPCRPSQGISCVEEAAKSLETSQADSERKRAWCRGPAWTINKAQLSASGSGFAYLHLNRKQTETHSLGSHQWLAQFTCYASFCCCCLIPNSSSSSRTRSRLPVPTCFQFRLAADLYFVCAQIKQTKRDVVNLGQRQTKCFLVFPVRCLAEMFFSSSVNAADIMWHPVCTLNIHVIKVRRVYWIPPAESRSTQCFSRQEQLAITG